MSQSIDILAGLTEFTGSAELEALFSRFGDIEACFVPPVNHRRKDPGFLQFSTFQAATAAIEACSRAEIELQGSQVVCRYHNVGQVACDTFVAPPQVEHPSCAAGKQGSSIPSAELTVGHWAQESQQISNLPPPPPPPVRAVVDRGTLTSTACSTDRRKGHNGEEAAGYNSYESGAALGRYTGEMMDFIHVRGQIHKFRFIECKELPKQLFGRDVFMMSAFNPDATWWPGGTQVSFVLKADESGRPQAFDVQLLEKVGDDAGRPPCIGSAGTKTDAGVGSGMRGNSLSSSGLSGVSGTGLQSEGPQTIPPSLPPRVQPPPPPPVRRLSAVAPATGQVRSSSRSPRRARSASAESAGPRGGGQSVSAEGEARGAPAAVGRDDLSSQHSSSGPAQAAMWQASSSRGRSATRNSPARPRSRHSSSRTSSSPGRRQRSVDSATSSWRALREDSSATVYLEVTNLPDLRGRSMPSEEYLTDMFNPTLKTLPDFDKARGGDPVQHAWSPSPDMIIMRMQNAHLTCSAARILHGLELFGKELQVRTIPEREATNACLQG